jgi:TM2 domain-containing membrane protein YozV
MSNDKSEAAYHGLRNENEQTFDEAQAEIGKEFADPVTDVPAERIIMLDEVSGLSPEVGRNVNDELRSRVTPNERYANEQPYRFEQNQKQVHVAYILLIFFGVIGVHKFYLGRAGLGVAYIFTLGFFGIGVLIDIFTLNTQTLEANAKMRRLHQ